jgi:hypothetical protein
MKKLLLVATLGVASLVSASSPIEKKLSKNTESLFGKIVFQAYAAYDGPDGTCFVWGTFTLNPEQGTFQFAPSSTETMGTMIVPPCTGAGSYLV